MGETLKGRAALCDKAKKQKRISNAPEAIDEEIDDLVSAALADMDKLGIDSERLCPESATVNAMEPLAVRAVMLYVKAHFGVALNEAETARYQTCYDTLTQSMSLTEKYRKVEIA